MKKHSMCKRAWKRLRGFQHVPWRHAVSTYTHACGHVCAHVIFFDCLHVLEDSPLKGRPRHLLTELRAFTASWNDKIMTYIDKKRSIAHDPIAFCVCLCVIPSEMPLDSVELSACPRVGVWLSSTLSSSRCLDPALGNVALLNSTVFVLWIKLQHTQERVKDRVFLLNRNQKNITCRNRYKADPTSGNFCFMLQSSFYKVYQARNKASKAVKWKAWDIGWRVTYGLNELYCW